MTDARCLAARETRLNKTGQQSVNAQIESTTSLRIAAVGDIALNGGYHQLAHQGRAGVVASAIAPLLAGCDLVIGNLEGPLTKHPPVGPPWRFCLHGDPAYASELRVAGFHAVSLANNHMLDHGWTGVEETIRHLEAADIRYFGVGKNLEEARRPLRVTVNGTRIAILAYCQVSVLMPLYAGKDQPGVAPAHRSYILEDIAQAKRENQIVIVCIHWGQEQVRYPTPKHRTLAREMISAGANLIIGHHPHVLQGIERVRGAAVAYSLGNFTFSEEEWAGANAKGEAFSMAYRISETSRRTGVWRVSMDSQGLVTEETLDPVYLARDLFPIPDSRAERRREIDRNRKTLSRPGYVLFWGFQMIGSRLRAILDQYGGAKEVGKRLLHIRPRHFRDLARTLLREWQQFKGTESK
jgi:poly-gamma-glutamate capsule biosynthesis protein CapA/YwtB (metallophosphatase superfamily)